LAVEGITMVERQLEESECMLCGVRQHAQVKSANGGLEIILREGQFASCRLNSDFREGKTAREQA
jgi:hypothetical protein